MNACNPPGRRVKGRNVTPCRFGGVDQLVERDVVRLGQGEQQLEGRLPATGLEARQGAHRDPGLGGQVRQGGVPLQPELPKSGADALQGQGESVVDHDSICRYGKDVCQDGMLVRTLGT